MGRRVLAVVVTVIAVTVSVFSSIYVVGNSGLAKLGDPIDPSLFAWLSFILAIGAAVLLVWRHKWPMLVCGLAIIPPLLQSDAMAALIALAALAAARRDRVLWLGGLLVYGVTALAVWRDAGWHESITMMGTWVADSGPAKVFGTLATAAVLTAIPLTVGILRGTRAELRTREHQEALLRVEMSRQEERSRIAHEMHDVLGHRLSLLSLQAGALEVSPPDRTGDAARTVRTTAKQSLEDLRQVIGVLRDGRDFHLQGPVPTLADLPTLVGQTRQAGVPVNLTVMLDMAVPAPAPLAMAVYRIVQESLTNIVRHAPGAPAEVVIRGGPGLGVQLEVVNALLAPAPPSPGSGSGLTGISERVNALGGRVNIGPTTNGTFAVQAWLPWPFA